MKFKQWLNLQEMWISKGKASKSLFKPGPRNIGPKPSDAKPCGQGGGPGACTATM